jgi:hypothetical protein
MRSAPGGIGDRSGPLVFRKFEWCASLRIVISTLVAIATPMLSGCERNSPRAVARRFVENLQHSNYARCYTMLTDQDRKDRTLAEFLTEIPLAPDVGPALFGPVLRNIGFEPGEVQLQADHAVVGIEVTAPDLPLWERTLDAHAGADHAGGQDAGRSLAAGDFPTVTYNDGIVMTRQHHRWQVFADFTDRDRIVDLHRDAIVEYHQYQYEKVITDYQEMIRELDQRKFTGAAGLAARYRAELAAVQTAQADAPAAIAYAAKSLTLSDIAMRMSEERVPAIFGSITNTGARVLDSVQIAVTWYEGRGQDLKIAYLEKHPVVITPIEFTDFSVPVLPFLPGEKRPFGFILTAPVQVQQDAAPYITVSAVGFTYSKAPLPKLASAAAPSATAPSPPASPPLPSAAPSRWAAPHSRATQVAP